MTQSIVSKRYEFELGETATASPYGSAGRTRRRR